MNPAQGGWLILASLVVALVLSIFHLPETWPQWLGWLRPAWVPLFVFFWVMALPHRLGLVSAWIFGIFVDVLFGDPIGLNGAVLAGITYIGWRFYERLRMYSVVQQCGVVFLLILGGDLVRMLVHDLSADRGWSWAVLVPALTSMLVWPFVSLFLQRLRLQFGVE
ncbi:MAG TPA: rod shape-determining protein MreD [Pseudomonadales bacterium]